MSNVPSISAVIPAFNAVNYVAEAIDSVLAQTVSVWEVIVVDDGSTDNTFGVASSYGTPVKCVRQDRAGPGRARNRGVSQARGAFLAFLDADDLWLPDKLERQLAAFAADPSPEIVFGAVEQFICPLVGESLTRRVRLPDQPQTGLVAGTMMLSSATFATVGSFDETLHTGEFIDWFARAKDLGLRIEALSAPVMRRRIHTHNKGLRDRDTYASGYLSVLREILRRRGKLSAD